FDTGMAIYTGACGSFTELACNDDDTNFISRITLPISGGVNYRVLAGGYDADSGNLVFHLNFTSVVPAFLPGSLKRGTNGFQFTFSGMPGSNYEVWASTNLFSWTALDIFTMSNTS